MKIKLARAQMGHGPAGSSLDITVKSAKGLARKFAPTWDMVMDFKRDGDREKYTRKYRDILTRLERIDFRNLWALGKESGSLTFLCYCRDGEFCHTYLLIEWLIEQFPGAFEKA